MIYKIWQIPHELIENDDNVAKLLFQDYDYIKEKLKTLNEILKIYRVIYEDEFKLEDFPSQFHIAYSTQVERDINGLKDYEILELIFERFNIHHPDDFKGHSLSTCDIVQLDDKYYMCNSIGWKEVE